MITGYKLFRLRKDSSLGSLFINRRQRIPIGVWLKAESYPTKGYAVRPGWHVLPEPIAPHLSLKDRIWCLVDVEDIIDIIKRPACQGGVWWLANQLRVVEKLKGI